MFPTPPYPSNKRNMYGDDENQVKKWKNDMEPTNSWANNAEQQTEQTNMWRNDTQQTSSWGNTGNYWDPTMMAPNGWEQSAVNPQYTYCNQNLRFTPPLDLQNQQNLYDLTRTTQTPVNFAVDPASSSSTLLTPESDLDNSRDSSEWLVDARCPVVNRKCKMLLDADQLRRRCEDPEFMNMTSLLNLFRKSKKKDQTAKIKTYLAENGINIPKMQRQKVSSKFTFLLEQESVMLAEDIGNLLKRFFPKETLGRKTLERLLEQGKTPEQCLESLRDSILCMEQIIVTISSRQPAISGQTEKIKRNAVDADKDRNCQELNEKYEKFSRLTHGFGHADSLNYYKKFQEVFEEAMMCCEAICQGRYVQLTKGADEPKGWKYEMKVQEDTEN